MYLRDSPVYKKITVDEQEFKLIFWRYEEKDKMNRVTEVYIKFQELYGNESDDHPAKLMIDDALDLIEMGKNSAK